MIQIRKEAEDIITGKQPKDNNLLKNAPHPISVMTKSDSEWNRCVSFHVFDGDECLLCLSGLTLVKWLRTLYSGCANASSGRQSLGSMMVSTA